MVWRRDVSDAGPLPSGAGGSSFEFPQERNQGKPEGGAPLTEFHHIQAAFTAFAFADERLRHTKTLC